LISDGVPYSWPEIPQQRKLSNIDSRSRLGFQTEKCLVQGHGILGVIELYAHCTIISGRPTIVSTLLARRGPAASLTP